MYVLWSSNVVRYAVACAVQELPDFETRRKLLARDPLACIYGFQVLALLALRHIFGLNVCLKCPDCATSGQPCTNAFGSNALARGGVFGRIDAMYGSLECQKSGAFHLHGQFFVQCFHQFHSVNELVQLGPKAMLELLRMYSDYSAHISRKVYERPEDWEEEEQIKIEAWWPEYKLSTLMLSKPNYQSDKRMAAAEWRMAYLSEDVEALQKHKQHHVHIMDGKGVRQPLNHCRDPKDPSKCKAHFPREKWLTEAPYLVCPELAKKKDMPHKGKKSMTGTVWGPCNDPNINGTHPALLAGLRCNSDVQLPYRFPITADTHCHHLCKDKCDEKLPLWQLVREAQTNQAAQAGYACDYQNKRVQIANHETKEWMKGQQHLYEDLKENKAGYFGARSVKRLITDCYGRGVVRGAVETTNLNIKAGSNDPTAAETIKTAQVVDISLQYALKLLQSISEGKPWPKEPCKPIVDKRNPVKRKIMDCPPWTVYGGRGARPEVHGLSAYEFARHFQIKQAKYPYTKKVQEEEPEKFEAELTEEGLKKTGGKMRDLRPGVDYKIREEGGEGWLALGDGLHMKPYRHDWIIAIRPRPLVPVVYGAQGSRTKEEQAMRILLLFFPWVNDVKDASPQVPFINHLWQPDLQDWTQALLSHASQVGFPTLEVKRLVLNFVFIHCLPRQARLVDGLAENSDDEDMVDELVDFKLDDEDLLKATLTHVRGSGCGDPADGDESLAEGADDIDAEPAAPTRLYDMTMEMFQLSGKIWKEDALGNDAARQRYEETLAGAVADDDAALQAARQSSRGAGSQEGSAGLIGEMGAEVEAPRGCEVSIER